MVWGNELRTVIIFNVDGFRVCLDVPSSSVLKRDSIERFFDSVFFLVLLYMEPNFEAERISTFFRIRKLFKFL
jgi:hypothetical protein